MGIYTRITKVANPFSYLLFEKINYKNIDYMSGQKTSTLRLMEYERFQKKGMANRKSLFCR